MDQQQHHHHHHHQQQQQQQVHHHHIPDDHNSNLSGAPYGFYQQEQEQPYGLPYNQQPMQSYQQVMPVQHSGAAPRGFSNVF
jgi:hypothetical protein